jgi:hypothetical protein
MLYEDKFTVKELTAANFTCDPRNISVVINKHNKGNNPASIAKVGASLEMESTGKYFGQYTWNATDEKSAREVIDACNKDNVAQAVMVGAAALKFHSEMWDKEVPPKKMPIAFAMSVLLQAPCRLTEKEVRDCIKYSNVFQTASLENDSIMSITGMNKHGDKFTWTPPTDDDDG